MDNTVTTRCSSSGYLGFLQIKYDPGLAVYCCHNTKSLLQFLLIYAIDIVTHYHDTIATLHPALPTPMYMQLLDLMLWCSPVVSGDC